MICQKDILDPARASALAATLGLRDAYGAGDDLPPFFHHIYFWQAEIPDAVGRDGHPKVGGLIPDLGLPRRMWAGGRLSFHAPLKAGHVTEKRSYCEEAQHKTGKTGPLGLVTLRHDFYQGDTHCLTEWQDLIYRADPSPEAARPDYPKAPREKDTEQQVAFDTTLLFRYSALTFNGHRIHYDLDYAKEIEGYDGLVVHGPLLAQLLMLKAAEELGALAEFRFRATSPLFHHERASLKRKDNQLWVAGPDGRQCLLADARPA